MHASDTDHAEPDLLHPQRAAHEAMTLIRDALDADQLDRLRALMFDAGQLHVLEAVRDLVVRPAPAT